MFNTYVVPSRPVHHHHNHHTEVHEHRAPTDDSVKLLEEMERKIEQRFFDRQPLETAFGRMEVLTHRELHRDTLNVVVRVAVNGREPLNVRTRISTYDIEREAMNNPHEWPEVILGKVRADLADAIAKRLIGGFPWTMDHFRGTERT